MNSDQLLAQFDKVAEAPDAIPRLRRFILDLAVRGKLVSPACRQAGKTPTTLPQSKSGKWWAYVIECEDGSFYKGHTDNLPRRWKQHCAGTAAQWTKVHKPKQVFYWEQHPSREAALKREKYLKSGAGREWLQREVVDKPEAWEPASELLKRIATEKERLVKEKKIKKPKAFPPIAEEEIPFEVPTGWKWSQLAEVGIIDPRNDEPDAATASFVPMPLIHAAYGKTNEHEPKKWREIKKGYTHFREGDVGLAKITPCFENGKSTVFQNLEGGFGAGTTELHIVRPIETTPSYILIFLKSSHYIETGIPKMTGTAGQKRVPKTYFTNSPFPLPPLAEQKRIVAKVDELMALCDQLEAQLTTTQTQSQQLLEACLRQAVA